MARKDDPPKTLADVAVTGKFRPLDLSATDRERLQFTHDHLNPPVQEQSNLNLPKEHS